MRQNFGDTPGQSCNPYLIPCHKQMCWCHGYVENNKYAIISKEYSNQNTKYTIYQKNTPIKTPSMPSNQKDVFFSWIYAVFGVPFEGMAYAEPDADAE